MHVLDQIMIIYAGNSGALDKVDKRKVKAWEESVHEIHEGADARGEGRSFAKEKKMTDEVIQKLDAAIAAFGPQFKA